MESLTVKIAQPPGVNVSLSAPSTLYVKSLNYSDFIFSIGPEIPNAVAKRDANGYANFTTARSTAGAAAIYATATGGGDSYAINARGSNDSGGIIAYGSGAEAGVRAIGNFGVIGINNNQEDNTAGIWGLATSNNCFGTWSWGQADAHGLWANSSNRIGAVLSSTNGSYHAVFGGIISQGEGYQDVLRVKSAITQTGNYVFFDDSSEAEPNYYNWDAGIRGTLTRSTLSANRTWTLPNASGTLLLDSTATNFVDLSTSQTITGVKTFDTPPLINNLTASSSSSSAVNKAYVDNIATSIHVHEEAHVILRAPLVNSTGGTVAYTNGTDGVGAKLTVTGGNPITASLASIDGDLVVASGGTTGSRILIAGETNSAWNGIYTISAVRELTRATDFDTPIKMNGGDFVFVTHGTTYADTGWICSEPVSTIGTSAVTFIQFSGAGTYDAGTGLTRTGTIFSITNTGVNGASTSYGSASSIPVLTVNPQGQITAVTPTTINDTTKAALAGASFTGAISSTGTVTGTNLVYKGGNGDAAALTVGTNDANSFIIKTNNTSKMTVLSDGNVGIGTITPTSKLVVVGDGYFGSSGSSKITIAAATAGNASLVLTPNATGSGNSFITSTLSTASLQLQTDSVTRMTILSGGNVGIGNTNPQTSLHITGSGGSGGGRLRIENTTDSAVLEMTSSGSTNYLFANAGNWFVRTDNSAKHIYLQSVGYQSAGSNGNVQVGGATTITVPTSQLTVRGNTNTSTTGLLDVQSYSGTSRLFVRDDGNVGVATITPSEKLTVTGNVKASSFITTTGTSSQFLKADGSIDSNSYVNTTAAVSTATANSIMSRDASANTAVNVLNAAAVNVNNKSVATQNFAIVMAIALG